MSLGASATDQLPAFDASKFSWNAATQQGTPAGTHLHFSNVPPFPPTRLAAGRLPAARLPAGSGLAGITTTRVTSRFILTRGSRAQRGYTGSAKITGYNISGSIAGSTLAFVFTSRGEVRIGGTATP